MVKGRLRKSVLLQAPSPFHCGRYLCIGIISISKTGLAASSSLSINLTSVYCSEQNYSVYFAHYHEIYNKIFKSGEAAVNLAILLNSTFLAASFLMLLIAL
jgi:hypothetical protein